MYHFQRDNLVELRESETNCVFRSATEESDPLFIVAPSFSQLLKGHTRPNHIHLEW